MLAPDAVQRDLIVILGIPVHGAFGRATRLAAAKSAAEKGRVRSSTERNNVGAALGAILINNKNVNYVRLRAVKA
jgi:hypothetical protein